MTVEANAKVNLTLEVYGRRADGYHGLRSVVLPIGLADELTIDASPDGEVSSDTGYGDGDLVVRAARDFEDYLSVSMEVDARVVAHGPSPEGRNVLRVRLVGDGAPTGAVAPKPRGYVIEVGDGGVSVVSADGRAFARALYHLEDLISNY